MERPLSAWIQEEQPVDRPNLQAGMGVTVVITTIGTWITESGVRRGEVDAGHFAR